MTDSDFALTGIQALVKNFKALSASARKGMNENATRQGYILPMFRLLGWNVDNVNEVSPEEKVSRGFVDFSFRIGGIPRYFLETKRANEDLNDPRWVQQAIDYAWTKSVTWALLSDFESLRVFNAEWKESDPFRAQFLEFDLESYLTDFDRLWWFSREETLAGRLDREADKVGKRIKRLPVTLNLFDDLKQWRSDLYKSLRGFNPLYSPAQIDEAVLRLLNRLIFIRTAEDRDVEPMRLMPLLRELEDRHQMDKLSAKLVELFRQFDATYNSELFAPHFSEELYCDRQPLEELIRGLYEKNFVRYNFNALEADVLGTAYEQYLGHVVTEVQSETGLLAAASHMDEKRTKRKSQGIYYTPAFVTKYIVQQTVSRWLDEHGYNPSAPPRILDMACGSGSFLIEAFDTLDRFVAKQRNQVHGQSDDLHDNLRRLELLQSCIFGVDKDKQAVDVARLNLLLRALHGRQKLPLLTNIYNADSLRPETWQQAFPEIMQEGGFDVIVGNPPYGAKFSEEEKTFLKENFNFKSGKPDSYIYFVEKTVQLLKNGGILGLILPNAWLTNYYGQQLRKYLLDNCQILVVVNLEPAEVFADAIVDTVILIARKESGESARLGNEVDIFEGAKGEQIDFKQKIVQKAWAEDKELIFNLLIGKSDSPVLGKIENTSISLGEICSYSQGIIPYTTAQESETNPYISSDRKTLEWKPLLDSGDCVSKYSLTYHNKFILYGKWLARRRDKKYFEEPKILFQRIRKKLPIQLVGTYDDTGFYNRHSLSNIILHDDVLYSLKYILGLFNSSLLNYWFVNRYGLLMEVGGFKISQLPIHRIDFTDPAEKSSHDEIVKLVEEMLALQKQRQQAEVGKEDARFALQKCIQALDQEIDARVYRLYGLTDAEIKIVEGK
jgi:type I restriction-modification system DNA methylase subunit